MLYQILQGLQLMHSAGIVHRDLKPSNILIDAGTLKIKIADFGLSRGMTEEEQMSTTYVVTRNYRAPELLLDWDGCAQPVDMWSVGCIFAEMLMFPRKILFPGHSHLEQIDLITDVVGTPSQGEAKGSKSGLQHVLNMKKKLKKPWKELVPSNTNPQCIDLLDKMLCFDPNKRITASQALNHPFFGPLRNSSMVKQSTTCKKPFLMRIPPSPNYKDLLYIAIMDLNKKQGTNSEGATMSDQVHRYYYNTDGALEKFEVVRMSNQQNAQMSRQKQQSDQRQQSESMDESA